MKAWLIVGTMLLIWFRLMFVPYWRDEEMMLAINVYKDIAHIYFGLLVGLWLAECEFRRPVNMSVALWRSLWLARVCPVTRREESWCAATLLLVESICFLVAAID